MTKSCLEPRENPFTEKAASWKDELSMLGWCASRGRSEERGNRYTSSQLAQGEEATKLQKHLMSLHGYFLSPWQRVPHVVVEGKGFNDC